MSNSFFSSDDAFVASTSMHYTIITTCFRYDAARYDTGISSRQYALTPSTRTRSGPKPLRSVEPLPASVASRAKVAGAPRRESTLAVRPGASAATAGSAALPSRPPTRGEEAARPRPTTPTIYGTIPPTVPRALRVIFPPSAGLSMMCPVAAARALLV